MLQSKQHSQTDKISWKQFLVISVIVFFVVLAKLMPYLLPKFGWEIPVDQSWSYFWNFSPMLPLALVAGATFSLRWAVLIPTLAWLAGDLGIWALTGHRDWAFYPMSPFIYLLMWMTVFIGATGVRWVGEGDQLAQSVRNLFGGFVGATLFFLISNFLVWSFGNAVFYPLTLAGLLECYTLAIPFYRNSLVGMVIYVPVLTMLFRTIVLANETVQTIELENVQKA